MFTQIPDFDEQTRGGARCSSCGSDKMPQHPCVYRGEMIDMEGFYDVCHACVLQLADEAGMVSQGDHDKAILLLDDISKDNDLLGERIESLEQINALLTQELARFTKVETVELDEELASLVP